MITAELEPAEVIMLGYILAAVLDRTQTREPSTTKVTMTFVVDDDAATVSIEFS